MCEKYMILTLDFRLVFCYTNSNPNFGDNCVS